MKKFPSIAVMLLCFLSNMNAQEWTDVTSQCVTNPTYNGNTNGWTYTYTRAGGSVGYTNHCFRFFGAEDGDVYQIVTVPAAGTYRISVNAFNRPGVFSQDAVDAYYNDTETQNIAYMYANDVRQTLKSMYSDYSSTPLASYKVDSEGRYYPDNSSSAYTMLSAGKYLNQVTVTVGSDCQLTIGINTGGYVYNSWLCITNWKVEQMQEAQERTWTEPVAPTLPSKMTSSTLEDGSFYLYNVGAGQFLTSGGYWGTQACLSDTPMELGIEDGTYYYGYEGYFIHPQQAMKHLESGWIYSTSYRFFRDATSAYGDWNYNSTSYGILAIEKQANGYYHIRAAAKDPIFGQNALGEEYDNQWFGRDLTLDHATDSTVSSIMPATSGNAIDWALLNINSHSYAKVYAAYRVRTGFYALLETAFNDGCPTATAAAVYNNSSATATELSIAYNTLYEEYKAYMLKKKLADASTSNPIEITEDVMYNADMSLDCSNGRIPSGWTITVTGTNVGGRNASYSNGEAYLNRFIEAWASSGTLGDGIIAQELSGLPAGKYVLEADINAYDQNNGNGSNVTGVYLFMVGQDESQEVHTACATEEGKPKHYTVTFMHDGDGILTAGVRIESTNCNWIGADNFKITYYGNEVNSSLLELETLVNSYNEALNYYCNNEVASTFSNAMSQARNLISQGTATEQQVSTIKTTLTNAYNAVLESKATYQSLAQTISQLWTLYDNTSNYSADDWKALNQQLYSAYNTANTAYEGRTANDNTLTTAQQQYSNLKTEYDRLVKEKEEGQGDETGEWIDITSDYLKNPDFNNNTTTGWNIIGNYGGNGVSNQEMEFWQGYYDIYQYVAVPFDGKYRLSVQGYFRPSANSQSAIDAYEDGTITEYMTCYLYLNEQQTAIQSIYSNYIESTGFCYKYTDGYISISGGISNYYSVLKELGESISDQDYYTVYQATLANYPNTMETGAEMFSQGYYSDNSVTITLNKGDQLRLGIKNNNYAANNWVLFDNFKLEWLGTEVLATGITLNASEINLLVGEQAQLTATVQPDNATLKTVSFESDNEEVATVDENGVISCKGVGTAVITVRIANGSSTATAQCTIHATRGTVSANALIINEVQAANVGMFLDPSFNYGAWIELYNSTNNTVSLEGLYLSDDVNNLKKHRLDSRFGVIKAKEYKALWFDHHSRHAPTNLNFNLDCDGGSVYISNEDGTVLSKVDYPMGISRCSYARTTDGGNEWRYTDRPTLEASNATTTYADVRLGEPNIDTESGVFEDGETLSVNVTFPAGAKLIYTTDGTAPSHNYYNGIVTGSPYNFEITSNTVLRLRLIQDGMLAGPVVTRSYLFRNKNYTLPIVNIVADYDDIQGSHHGIFVQGEGNGIPGNGYSSPCNWNADWERPVHFEYFSADGKLAYSQEVGMESAGGWSRAWYPHSSNLKAKKVYEGNNKMPFQFFDRENVRYKAIKLRNGGNEYNSGRMKDAALQYIVRSSGLYVETQGFQPVHQFFNGNYIGVLNLREPNGKHYAYTAYGLDPDSVDQFKMSPDSGYVQQAGDRVAWERLLKLAENAQDESVYTEIEKLVDIEEYINYVAVQFYAGGTDYPQNNIKGFRDRNDGRFRFVIFDTDFAFNGANPFDNFTSKHWRTSDKLYGVEDLYPDGTITCEIEFVPLFLNMMKNAKFQKQFIDAYSIITGSVFEPTRCQEITQAIADEVNPAFRVGNERTFSTSKLTNYLTSYMQSQRISQLETFMYNYYEVTNTQQNVTLSSEMEEGILKINNLPVPTNKFSGQLFYPITVQAVTPTGYTFAGWKNNNGKIVSRNANFELEEGTTYDLTATFSKMSQSALNKTDYCPVKINEVSANESGMYVNDLGKKSDWFELYNTTDNDIDIEGMYISDKLNNPKKMTFEAQEGVSTIIPAHGHIIVWADKKEGVSQLHANFKLNNEDSCAIVLTAADESWADTLVYHRHTEQQTIGLYPDGASTLYTFDLPTINKTNIISYYAQLYKEIIPTPISPTGLDEIEDNDIEDTDAVYDLSGRKVSDKSHFGSLPRGIYIINGRKVLR